MCQPVWWNPTTWGCGVSNAWNSLSTAFQNRVAGPFINGLLNLVFSLFDIIVYAILDGISSLIDGEIQLIANISRYLGPFSLPVFVGLFFGFFAILYLVAGIMKDIPVLGALA